MQNLQDALQTQLLQERKVLFLWKATPVDPGRDHVEIIWWTEILGIGQGLAAGINVHGIHGDGARDRYAGRGGCVDEAGMGGTTVVTTALGLRVAAATTTGCM